MFVWIGEGANASEKKEAERCAIVSMIAPICTCIYLVGRTLLAELPAQIRVGPARCESVGNSDFD